MTDTITTESTHDAEAIGTLERLNPHTLVVDTNVRDEAGVDAEFIASITDTASWSRSPPCAPQTGRSWCGPDSAAPSPENCRVVSGVVGPVPKSVRRQPRRIWVSRGAAP
jgi:hypothetical protein